MSTFPTSSNSGTTVIPLNNLYVIPGYVHQYLGSTTGYNPVRIRFQLSASSGTISHANGGKIKITSTSQLAAGITLNCYFKKFISSTLKYKSDYVIYYPSVACTETSNLITINVPRSDLQNDALYELVISSKNPIYPKAYTSTNIGINSFSSNLHFSIVFSDSSPLFYSFDRFWGYNGGTQNNNLKLSEFYLTSKVSAEASNIFLSFQIAAGITLNSFPKSYIEIEFPTYNSMFPNQLVTSDSSNSEHACYLSSSIPTQAFLSLGAGYQSPRCILIYGDASLNLPSVIRIENYKQFIASMKVMISIENIILPSSTSPSVDFRIIFYTYPVSFWKKYFINVYDSFNVITTVAAISKSAIFSRTSGYWSSPSATLTATATNWYPGSIIKDKLLIKIPIDFAKFINFGSGSTFALTGATLTTLYRNTKNYYICNFSNIYFQIYSNFLF